jgi:hypothetical protein
MKPLNLAALTAVLLVVSTTQAGAAGTLASAIGNCSVQTDEKLRLACYDQIAAQLKAASAQMTEAAPAQTGAPPPKQEHAWYDVGSWFGSSSQKPPSQQTTPADFGAENLPRTASVAPAAPAAPAAAPATTPAPAATPPQKGEGAWYDVGGWFTPKPPSQQTTVADFGSENLPSPQAAPGAPAAPEPLDEITADVADVAFNFRSRFIVTLENGQIWKQLDSDTGVAHFSKHGKNRVTISRGLIGSYNLVIEGRTALFKVKRIR